MKTISGIKEWAAAVEAARKPWHSRYIAMYDGGLDAVTTDPLLWRIPADDHLVHRGDGVFDMFKCERRAAYNFKAHMERFMRSARAIGLEWKKGAADIERIVLETLAVADRPELFARMTLSRGPGSFAVNPYDSEGPVLYVMAYEWHGPFMESHPQGAKACESREKPKDPRYATMKSCNYLPNAMMKRDAADAGCDFAASFDARGFLAEGATENFGIVSAGGELLFPKADGILQGVTMERTMELARGMADGKLLRGVRRADISRRDMEEAREIIVTGTTLDVVSVTEWNGRPAGGGAPGPVATALNAALRRDILENGALRTPY